MNILSPLSAMLAGAIAGFINTGNLTGAIMGGISGAFFAGAGEIGDTFGTFAGVAANGTSGGLMSMMNGGKFARGFITAGVTKFAGSIGGGNFGVGGKGFGHMFTRVAIAETIGGVASRVVGGDFWSGFRTGAFQRLFNDESHGDGYFATHAQAKAYAMRKTMGYGIRDATIGEKLDIASGALGIASWAFAPLKLISLAIDGVSLAISSANAYVAGDITKLAPWVAGKYASTVVRSTATQAQTVRIGVVYDQATGVALSQ